MMTVEICRREIGGDREAGKREPQHRAPFGTRSRHRLCAAAAAGASRRICARLRSHSRHRTWASSGWARRYFSFSNRIFFCPATHTRPSVTESTPRQPRPGLVPLGATLFFCCPNIRARRRPAERARHPEGWAGGGEGRSSHSQRRAVPRHSAARALAASHLVGIELLLLLIAEGRRHGGPLALGGNFSENAVLCFTAL